MKITEADAGTLVEWTETRQFWVHRFWPAGHDDYVRVEDHYGNTVTLRRDQEVEFVRELRNRDAGGDERQSDAFRRFWQRRRNNE